MLFIFLTLISVSSNYTYPWKCWLVLNWSIIISVDLVIKYHIDTYKDRITLMNTLLLKNRLMVGINLAVLTWTWLLTKLRRLFKQFADCKYQSQNSIGVDHLISSLFTEALVSIKLVALVFSMNIQREDLLSPKLLICR